MSAVRKRTIIAAVGVLGIAAIATFGGITFGGRTVVDTTPPPQITVTPRSALVPPQNVQVKLSWSAPTGATDVGHYVVYRDGKAIAHPRGTSYTDTPPGPAEYGYTVRAVDTSQNIATKHSPTAFIRVPNITVDLNDKTPPPRIPGVPKAGLEKPENRNVLVIWTAPEDPKKIAHYIVTRNGTIIARPYDSYILDTPPPGRQYNYRVTAVDTGGNKAVQESKAAVITVPPATSGDKTPPAQIPTAPTIQHKTGSNRVTVSWAPATDPSGISYYILTSNTNWIVARTYETSFDDYVMGNDLYTYRVKAVDKFGNVSTLDSPKASVQVTGLGPMLRGFRRP